MSTVSEQVIPDSDDEQLGASCCLRLREHLLDGLHVADQHNPETQKGTLTPNCVVDIRISHFISFVYFLIYVLAFLLFFMRQRNSADEVLRMTWDRKA